MLLRSYQWTPPVLLYYTNLVVDGRPCAAAVWHIAAIEFVTMVLMFYFMLLNEKSSGFSVMTQMDQSGCELFVLLLSAVRRHIKHYGFASLVVGCCFHSSCVCLAYRRSAEVNWSLIDSVHGSFPYGLPTGVYMAWLKQISVTREIVGSLVRIDCLLLEPLSGRCLLLEGAAGLGCRSHTSAFSSGPKGADPPPALSRDLDAVIVD